MTPEEIANSMLCFHPERGTLGVVTVRIEGADAEAFDNAFSPWPGRGSNALASLRRCLTEAARRGAIAECEAWEQTGKSTLPPSEYAADSALVAAQLHLETVTRIANGYRGPEKHVLEAARMRAVKRCLSALCRLAEAHEGAQLKRIENRTESP